MMSDGDLPTEFPIFPLTGAVLFPFTRLPLNIFEPRYLSMIDATLAGPRYLGMVQPRITRTETVGDDGDIYEVGCLGRLTAFAETEDGRYVVTLTGVARYRIEKELAMRNGYRRVRVRYDDFPSGGRRGAAALFDRARFMGTLSAYLTTLGVDPNQEPFDNTNDEALIAAISTTAPFTPEEKQAILECPGLDQQAEMVQSIMQIATHGNERDDPSFRH